LRNEAGDLDGKSYTNELLGGELGRGIVAGSGRLGKVLGTGAQKGECEAVD